MFTSKPRPRTFPFFLSFGPIQKTPKQNLFARARCEAPSFSAPSRGTPAGSWAWFTGTPTTQPGPICVPFVSARPEGGVPLQNSLFSPNPRKTRAAPEVLLYPKGVFWGGPRTGGRGLSPRWGPRFLGPRQFLLDNPRLFDDFVGGGLSGETGDFHF